MKATMSQILTPILRFRRGPWLALLALTFSALSPRAARAALPGDVGTQFQVNDENPLSSIPTQEERNANPLQFGYYVQDLVARAELGFEKKEWAKAVKYFEVLARLVPDRAVSFSRLCAAYAELGQTEIAAANCGRAVQLDGALVYDHLRFVRLTLDKKTFTVRDAADLDASLAHLRAHAPQATAVASAIAAAIASANAPPERTPDQVRAEFMRKTKAPGAPGAAASAASAPSPAVPAGVNLPLEIEVLSCRLAVRLGDAKRITACTEALRKIGADERLIVSFAWSRALILGDKAGAAAVLERAKTLRFPEAGMRAMLAENERAFGPTGVIGKLKQAGGAIAGVVTLLVFGGGALWVLRRRKPATAA